jgi:transcriptional regulator with GAF, ATPase, and Fis domain
MRDNIKTQLSSASAQDITVKLLRELSRETTRSSFFQTLSRMLKQEFFFDRLCINLYDPNSELLTYFSTAQGTVVSSLSPVRKAEKTTVAGHVIASRKPVVIMDIAEHFAESLLHPMTEAGLTTTMAFPLILNDEILGTLHCSFVRKPDDLYKKMELLLELCPSIAVCLGAILAVEQLEQGAALNPVMKDPPIEGCEDFIFESPQMRDFMSIAGKVAKMDIPLLLLGETGTGKSHLAHYIHTISNRRRNKFVEVNCPALATTIFESELFGHAKGAFTGASTKRTGRVELAHEGTLFLDEIAELGLEMQSKLLNVVDNKFFERVGESVSLSVDTRLIAATNVNIPKALKEGKLRSDFYYRLSTFTLELPPLRKRRSAIPILANYFMSKLSILHGLPAFRLSKSHMNQLLEYDWPGNIRELRNVINRLLITNSLSGELAGDDVQKVMETEFFKYGDPAGMDSAHQCRRPEKASISNLEKVERQHIQDVLKQTKGVISGPKGAAEALGLPRSTLQHKMRKLGIVRHKEQ